MWNGFKEHEATKLSHLLEGRVDPFLMSSLLAAMLLLAFVVNAVRRVGLK